MSDGAGAVGPPGSAGAGEQTIVAPWKTWQRDSDIPDRRNLIHQMCGASPDLDSVVSWVCTASEASLGGKSKLPGCVSSALPQPEAVSAAEA